LPPTLDVIAYVRAATACVLSASADQLEGIS
jgi:hypothetical protein